MRRRRGFRRGARAGNRRRPASGHAVPVAAAVHEDRRDRHRLRLCGGLRRDGFLSQAHPETYGTMIRLALTCANEQ